MKYKHSEMFKRMKEKEIKTTKPTNFNSSGKSKEILPKNKLMLKSQIQTNPTNTVKINNNKEEDDDDEEDDGDSR